MFTRLMTLAIRTQRKHQRKKLNDLEVFCFLFLLGFLNKSEVKY